LATNSSLLLHYNKKLMFVVDTFCKYIGHAKKLCLLDLVKIYTMTKFDFRSRFELTTLVVIYSDCISSCKSNYHPITATTSAMFCLGSLYVSSWIFLFFLELSSLYSKLNVLLWSWRLYVPGWLLCFGVGFFMFLVDCFVLELASLCS